MSDIEEKKPAMPEEQMSDLAALERAAGEAEAAAAVTGEGGAQAVPKPSLADEIGALLTMVTKTLEPALPSVAKLYTPEVVRSVGCAVGAVCEKHGWLQGGLMGKWGEEIMCLMIVGPLAYTTYEAASSDIAALKAKAEAEKPKLANEVSASSPGQKTVTFGNVPVPA